MYFWQLKYRSFWSFVFCQRSFPYNPLSFSKFFYENQGLIWILRLGGLEFLDFPIFISFESRRMKPYNLLSVYLVCAQVLVLQYITAKKPSHRLPVSHEFFLINCRNVASVFLSTTMEQNYADFLAIIIFTAAA